MQNQVIAEAKSVSDDCVYFFDQLSYTVSEKMQAPSFASISAHIKSNPDVLVVNGPKTSSTGIGTGTMGYLDIHNRHHSFILTGPPCEVFRLAPEPDQGVRFPKLTMMLARKAELEGDSSRLPEHVKQRVDFQRFVERLENAVLDVVKADPVKFFFKEIHPDNITMTSVLKPPKDDDHQTLMSCKLDKAPNAPQANIDPDLIQLSMLDEKKKPMDMRQMNIGDLYVVVVRAIYPWFKVLQVGKNTFGEVGLSFRAVALQRIICGDPVRPTNIVCSDAVLQKLLVAPSTNVSTLDAVIDTSDTIEPDPKRLRTSD